MKRVLCAGALAVFAMGSSALAASTVISGADLDTDASVTYTDSSFSEVGASALFSGGPEPKALFRVSLADYGIGTGTGQTTSGSVTVNYTMQQSDQDFWFALWDGTEIAFTTSWDGNRAVASGSNPLSDGLTFSFVGGTQTDFLTDVEVGDTADVVLNFDLVAGTTTLEAGGISASNVLRTLDVGSSLEFILFKGSAAEEALINSVTLGEAVVDGAIPVPAAALLFPAGAAFFARRRAKKNG